MQMHHVLKFWCKFLLQNSLVPAWCKSNAWGILVIVAAFSQRYEPGKFRWLREGCGSIFPTIVKGGDWYFEWWVCYSNEFWNKLIQTISIHWQIKSWPTFASIFEKNCNPIQKGSFLNPWLNVHQTNILRS